MQIQLKKHYGRYSKYKQTGIPWLGEVPMEWNLQPLKRMASFQSGDGFGEEHQGVENGEIPFCKVSDINGSDIFIDTANNFVSHNLVRQNRWHLIPKGSILTAKIGAALLKNYRKINIRECCIDNNMLAILPKKKVDLKYLFWFLHTVDFAELQNISSVPSVNMQMLRELIGTLPDSMEQIAISNYLDEKSALIESIIEQKQKQIELLKEKRASLINRAVTKGIRTKVMFDTNAFDQWQKLSKKEQERLLEQVEIIYTHIQEDELPSSLRSGLSAAKKVLTNGVILDVSRFDNCKFGGQEDSENIDTIVGNGQKQNHNRDALIANTAKMQHYLLITDDQRLQKKCSEIGSEAIPFKEFIACFAMKESGVEWIDQIPQSWRVSRLKFLTNKPFQYGANEAALEEDATQPRFVRITDVDENGNLRDDTFKSLNETLAKDFLLEDGDILFARSGATVGKTFQYKDSWGKCCFAGYLIRFSPNKKKIASDFFNYITSSRYYQEWKNSIFIQATIQNISAEKYKNFWITFPSIEEQNRVIKYLDLETKKIDLAIQKIDLSMALLREYKTSLVSSVVTGKIKVPNLDKND